MKAYYVGLPKSIKVGASEVKIELADQLDNGHDWGQYDPDTQCIRLATEQPSAGAAVDILLHELLHAVWNLARLRVNDDEERIVSALATWQSQVLLDNPPLVAWITKAVRGR